MTDKREQQWQQMILRLFEHPGREAILIPSMFTPPILLTNILRLGTELSKKGYTSPPDRRMGGWHETPRTRRGRLPGKRGPGPGPGDPLRSVQFGPPPRKSPVRRPCLGDKFLMVFALCEVRLIHESHVNNFTAITGQCPKAPDTSGCFLFLRSLRNNAHLQGFNAVRPRFVKGTKASRAGHFAALRVLL